MGVLDKVLAGYHALDLEKGDRRRATPTANPGHGEGNFRTVSSDPVFPDPFKILNGSATADVRKVLRGNIVRGVGRPVKTSKATRDLARSKAQERARLKQLLRPLRGHDPIIPMTFDKPSHR